MEKPKPKRVLSEADPLPPSACMRKRHRGSRLGKSAGWIPAPVHPLGQETCSVNSWHSWHRTALPQGPPAKRCLCYMNMTFITLRDCRYQMRQHLKSAIKIRKQRMPAQITVAAVLHTLPGSKEAGDWAKKRLKNCFDFALPECVQVAEKNKTFFPMQLKEAFFNIPKRKER